MVGVGTHTITLTATDVNGNTSTATTTFTVNDTTAPTLTAPANVTANTGAGATSCGTLVTDAQLGVAIAADNAGPVSVARSGVPAGNIFPVGTTTITYTATDDAGNSTSATQTVTVVDNTPPVITAPAPTSASADGTGKAPIPNVVATATVTDNCAPGVLSQSPAAGTIVSRHAYNHAYGNRCERKHQHRDDDVHSQRHNSPDTYGAGERHRQHRRRGHLVRHSRYRRTTRRCNCRRQRRYHDVARSGVPAGNIFPVGTTTITYTATDDAGNSTQATQTVTVIDNTPPVVTAPPPMTVSSGLDNLGTVPDFLRQHNCDG